MTADLECPHCGNQAFTDYGDGLVACQRCYVQFDLNEQQCPSCGSLLPEGAVACLQCGTTLRGELERRVFEERFKTAEDWRRARLAVVQQQRAETEKASSQRMDAWWEDDRKQRQAEHLERLARRRHERNLLIVTIAVVVIVLLVAAISLIVFSSGEPDPAPTTLLLHWSVGS